MSRILVQVQLTREEESVSLECWQNLDAEEKSASDKILDPVSRKQFVRARSLMKSAAWEFTGQRQSLTHLPDGRPCLSGNFFGIHLSASHSRTAVAVGISSAGPIGLDIEERLPLDPQEIACVFSGREIKHMERLPDQEKRFAWVKPWAEKEAVAKLLGCPPGLDASKLLEGAAPGVRLLSWQIEERFLALAFESPGTPHVQLQMKTV